MQTPTPVANEQNELIARAVSTFVTIVLLVGPVIVRNFPKLKFRKTDTGETRKVEVLLNMVSESQKEIEELKQENARLTVKNYNLHEDYDACNIRATNAENELKVLQKVVEVLRKPPAPPAETQGITGEGDKEAG